MKQVVYAYVSPDECGYIAQCLEPRLTAHGESLEEAIHKIRLGLQELVAGENLHKLGFAPQTQVVVTFFLGPVRISPCL